MGGSGGGPPGRSRSFQKICQKSMKTLQIFENFKRNFAIFSKIFKFLSNFWRKFGQKFRQNLEMCICREFGGGAPRR